ncbi:gamma-glutamyl-gamma-aminobutyrate hydrolase family protein [Staphylococcus massiliensis]|uniref:Uncharacterized protein n=1 Tax=Staphylococcus massiliensis S46 TaxID=1229783 RepID=K9B9P1_9STAP|nr:gamma-glutamyl-gamma-aminobutyrate hydrolase family protein [Staphylococcus massiliensis]EKU50455.1 hypothetical protein C273_00490 [Staphylococcus massiliensis S46]MCG3398775.1 gamma-glutamyl-gamma-aminobutyrate hydrolase family protein [Staphylococcus massiliensis]MCG3411882.1 gamma-glutamyl-gamma-aminobutyrate hydrolase family protein [Staphylococcus massiliensis]POA00471.1 gamma-glutamyl-gamma-aminobutyrate hydrolase [Staphylococcus massiliensis CCUG 55927]
MKRPVIGISCNISKYLDGPLCGHKRFFLNEDYVDAVIKNNGVPILLPIHEDASILKQQVEMLDGLIITGGQDISPLIYGEDPMPLLGEVNPKRDQYDLKLLDLAIQREIPILGICRGMQIINVFFGGTMWQDISYKDGVTYKHFQQGETTDLTHKVSIAKDTKLYQLLQTETLMVNSFHHQTIHHLASPLKATATANGGIIEGFEHKDYDFLLGVQWHPEMLHQTEDVMNRLFDFVIQSDRKE